MENCIFCKIVKGEIPSSKVYEDKDLIGIKDINPKAPIHILIIPKRHIKNLSVMKVGDINLVGKVNFASTKIAKKLGVGEQFKLTTNVGELAGQVVMHLHYHLLSGWKKRGDVVSELHL
jgi:histidine triad (HIT) family protein